jgi:hypothetical protein
MEAAKTVKAGVTNSSNIPCLYPLSSRQTAAMNRLALKGADQNIRRGGRVVECTALEMRHTCKGIVGSNPTLSAIFLHYYVWRSGVGHSVVTGGERVILS